MSASTETDPIDPASAGSASTRENGQQAAPGPSGGSDGKPMERTISCVSCRKRKLKCDRVKPKCGTCTRLRHECEYPERRRNLGSKRRNMKELEARLAQVETQLVSKSKKASPAQKYNGMTGEPDWNTIGMDINLDLGGEGLLDPILGNQQPGLGYTPGNTIPATSIPGGDFFSQELIALGLQEPLPPQDMMDELNSIYFEKYHVTLPMMHKLRYYASLDRAPHMRPPICLRYAMWAIAASLSDKYSAYDELLYERARRYVEAAEMKGHGEAFVSIYHAQTWGLIGTFEATKAFFSRAWVSVGRMVRLAQMLGLHRLDNEEYSAKEILPPARDWIDLEERRRTFWAAFYGDRWASSGTGWPMIIDEKDISTNLPCSEQSFENGVEEPTISLESGLTSEGAPKISPFAGVILSATLFGHNYQHLHRRGPNEEPGDLANGEFWKRHRRMENVLSQTFMLLPDNLRLPNNIRDMNVVFLHMNIHASTICLHQASIMTARKHNIDPNFIRQSLTRCLMAAEEITNIMRLISHIDASNMNSWMGFCLYVAGGVFVQDQKTDNPQATSIPNLEFILAAMEAIGNRHSITKHFTVQLELDMGSAGIGRRPNPYKDQSSIPNTPINGLLAGRGGLPMTVEEFNIYAAQHSPVQAACVSALERLVGGGGKDPIPVMPLAGIQIVEPPPKPPVFPPDWHSGHPIQGSKQNSMSSGQSDYQSQAENYSSQANNENGFGSFGNYDQGPATLAGNTPSSDSSSSNTMQYPYRQADNSRNSSVGLGVFPPESGYRAPANHEWNMQDPLTNLQGSFATADGLQEFLNNVSWNQNNMPE